VVTRCWDFADQALGRARLSQEMDSAGRRTRPRPPRPADHGQRDARACLAELARESRVAGAGQDMIGHDDARPGGRRADKAQCLFRRADARDRKSRLAQNRFADTQLSQVIVDEKSRGHETSIRRASRRGLAGAYTHTRGG
jgi:hypothetical protein